MTRTLQTLNYNASVFFLTAMSIDRYIAVAYNTRSQQVSSNYCGDDLLYLYCIVYRPTANALRFFCAFYLCTQRNNATSEKFSIDLHEKYVVEHAAPVSTTRILIIISSSSLCV